MPAYRKPPVDYIERTRALYGSMGFAAYGWRRIAEPPAFATLKKPLSECRLGLLGSGGVYEHGQTAFHFRDDISFRVIDTTRGTAALRATHFAYDLEGARKDPNVVFPIDPLQRLVAAGELGELSSRAYAFMGGIYSSRKVEETLAPELVARVVKDEVDVALLVPV
ncbi:MAG: glycine/sarcosine/betaine reductase selenoprotein B family protein [Acidobacteriota bacterium]